MFTPVRILFKTFLILCLGQSSNAQFPYPPTRVESFDTVIYHTKLTDNYAWLSRPENEPEMLSWARAQGQFTNNLLDSISGSAKLENLLNNLYKPSAGAILVAGTQGSYVYYYKTQADGERWLVRKNSDSDKEEKITRIPFSINGRKYTGKKFAFSFKRQLMAVMLVEKGEANPHIRIFDLKTRQFLEDSIGPVMFNDASGVSMAWLPNDAGIIYSQAPTDNSEEEKYYRGRLRLHNVGSAQEDDVYLFGYNVNKDIDIKDYETPYVYSYPHSPYIIARIRAGKGDNYAFAIHFSKLNGVLSEWTLLKEYRSNHGTFTANEKYLYAIDDAVPKMQLIRVDLDTGAPPEVVLPESEKILSMSTGDPSIVGGKDLLYLKYSAPGKQGILRIKYSNFQSSEVSIPYPGSVGEFNLLANDDLVFVTTNWIHDFEYFQISHKTGEVRPFPGGTTVSGNLLDYVSEIIFVPSRDGVRIPVSLLYGKGTRLGEKPRRLLIDAYGCFGASMDPYYNPEIFVWLETGGIFATAHIRGGSELGPTWHSAGAFPNKMNSINDIIDVADYFVNQRITTGKQQAITGSSCGSLNVGLATLQRPDLFGAGVFIVGIPDLVTNKGASFGRGQNDFGPLDTEPGFASRLSISSYHHIVPNKSAPAILVINGANDYIVPLHNAARYVAKLQNVQQSDRPSLFMVDWKNGHNGAGTALLDVIRKWKFLLWQTGHEEFRLTSQPAN